jgi:predicted ester cyclase
MLENEKIIREFYAAGNARGMDTDKFVSMFSEEGYMWDIASGTKFRGKAMGDSIAALAKAFPDVRRAILDVVVSGNFVVVEAAVRGTHKGELTLASGPLAPTGKTIDLSSCDVFRLENGKIVAFHRYNEASAMRRQLGVV